MKTYDKITMIIDGNKELSPRYRYIVLTAWQLGFDMIPILIHDNDQIKAEITNLILEYFGSQYRIPNLTIDELMVLKSVSLIPESIILWEGNKAIKVLSFEDDIIDYVNRSQQSPEENMVVVAGNGRRLDSTIEMPTSLSFVSDERDFDTKISFQLSEEDLEFVNPESDMAKFIKHRFPKRVKKR